jgi:methionyl aminopeptidase
VKPIEIKSASEIEHMRAAGALAAATLQMIEPHVGPGVSTEALNQLCHEFIIEHGAYPAPLKYRGFPKSICTSVNEVVCHGIPTRKQVLRDGDIINVDVTARLSGFHGDTSATFTVGRVSADALRLMEITRECMWLGIRQVKPGARVSAIGQAIQPYAEGQGCSVVREYCGHGIGREFHGEPQVSHYDGGEDLRRLKPGMIFTVEPMINLGTWQTKRLRDGWTVKTRDGQISAQYEHTVLVTDEGYDVLTDPEVLEGTEYLGEIEAWKLRE